MPVTIANCFSETSSPRLGAGEIYAMYKGDRVEAVPTANPPTKRALTNSTRVRGRAAATDENVNSAAAPK